MLTHPLRTRFAPKIELLRYTEGASYSPTPYSIGLQPEYFNKK